MRQRHVPSQQILTSMTDLSGWSEDVERDCSNSNKYTNVLVLPSSSLTFSYESCQCVMTPPRNTDRYNVSEVGCVKSRAPDRLLHAKWNSIFDQADSGSRDEGGRWMSGIPDRPGQKRNLSEYSHRLDTFQGGPQPWPRAIPSAQYLARIGFIYLGFEQAVKCFLCGIEISEWDDGKDPLIKHHYKNPDCNFVCEQFSSELKLLLSEERLEHRSPQYSSSSVRLQTFSNWQYTRTVTSYQLASAGFFYTGYGARVECFSCGLVHDDWRKGDLPLHIHRQKSLQCPFITSLLSKESHKPLNTTPTLLPPPVPSDYPASRVPDYSNLTVRLRSFKHLARDFPVSDKSCAEAGLFFLRKPDVMKCFSCGVIVRDWVNGDMPAEKHRQANSSCQFLCEMFPSKLDSHSQQEVASPESETVDPSTLPEPEFDEEELERMSMQHKANSKVEPNYEELAAGSSSLTLHSPVTHQAQPAMVCCNHDCFVV